MTCTENIGPDEHNKETPNMGLDKEKLPVQQPICAENIGPDEHNKKLQIWAMTKNFQFN